MLRRIYEKVLLKYWEKETWAQLHPSQAGFRRGFSTLSHILLSDELSKTMDISVFLDLMAAFDRLPHQRQLDILEDAGCPNHTRKIIYNLMMNECSSNLVVNNRRLVDPVKRLQGVFQGSIISPLLFNVFINPLACRLNADSPKIPRALFYADDILLKGSKTTDVQRLIDICSDWAKTNGMKWGIAKCGTVGSKHLFQLQGSSIPTVESYKYLGVPHGPKGIEWDVFLKQKENKVISLIRSLLSRRRLWSFKTRLIIFKTFIRSTIEYCLPTLSLFIHSQESSRQQALQQTLTRIHKLSHVFIFDNDRPMTLLDSISGLGSLQSQQLILQASLCRQLKQISPSNPLNSFLNLAPVFRHPSSLLNTAMHSKLYKDFCSFTSTHPNQRRRWDTFCRQFSFQELTKQPGILHHYIRPRARFKGKVDSCLHLPLTLATSCLKWRSNKLFLRRLCSQCSQPFNRAHLLSCEVLPPELNSLLNDRAFRQDTQDIRNEIDAKKTSQHVDFNYTPLDFLLNEKRFAEFQNALTHLDSTLGHPTSPT
jgi:hypothetical protein